MTFLDFLIVVAIIGLLATISIPAFQKVRKEQAKSRCIRNLGRIRDAKIEAAKELGLKSGEEIDKEVVDKHIKGRPPTCPAGGEYKYRHVGANPNCTIPGHRL
jgi:Tfp pilus assembly major pilin PilA